MAAKVKLRTVTGPIINGGSIRDGSIELVVWVVPSIAMAARGLLTARDIFFASCGTKRHDESSPRR